MFRPGPSTLCKLPRTMYFCLSRRHLWVHIESLQSMWHKQQKMHQCQALRRSSIWPATEYGQRPLCGGACSVHDEAINMAVTNGFTPQENQTPQNGCKSGVFPRVQRIDGQYSQKASSSSTKPTWPTQGIAIRLASCGGQRITLNVIGLKTPLERPKRPRECDR